MISLERKFPFLTFRRTDILHKVLEVPKGSNSQWSSTSQLFFFFFSIKRLMTHSMHEEEKYTGKKSKG